MKNNKYYFEVGFDHRISYSVVKTRRKTIGITVNRDGEVKVSSPLGISEKQIREVVQKKANWIDKKVKEVSYMNSNTICREFVSGERLLYLGKEYILEVRERNIDMTEVIIEDDILVVYALQGLSAEVQKQRIREALVKWYRNCFDEIIKESIEKYSIQLEVSPCKVRIKDQKTIWGSCSGKGNINLNWKLVMSPIDIIDYVVIHELSHLKFMNHSKDFWNLVKSIMPNYSQSREWLKANGYKLTL